MSKKEIGLRIKELIGSEPVTTFAKRCGISESLLRQYISGSVPGLDKAAQIARTAEVSLEWLAVGEGERKKCAIGRDGVIEGCKGTAKDRHEVHGVDVLCFKEDWVHTELKAGYADLCLFVVEGENMEPTLRPGDIILTDHRDTGPACDGIYILMIDGALSVKRIQRLPDGTLRITNDNQTYTPFEVNPKMFAECQFAVVGRVVWAGRKM